MTDYIQIRERKEDVTRFLYRRSSWDWAELDSIYSDISALEARFEQLEGELQRARRLDEWLDSQVRELGLALVDQ
jgi:hypothetical protein